MSTGSNYLGIADSVSFNKDYFKNVTPLNFLAGYTYAAGCVYLDMKNIGLNQQQINGDLIIMDMVQRGHPLYMQKMKSFNAICGWR